MLALASVGNWAVFGCYFGRGMRFHHYYGFPSGFGGFFPFLGLFKLLLAIGLLALIVYLVVKASQGKADGKANSKEALEILKERFARGEIGEEEFKKMKKTLLEG